MQPMEKNQVLLQDNQPDSHAAQQLFDGSIPDFTAIQ